MSSPRIETRIACSIAVAALALCAPRAAIAQFSLYCSSGSDDELRHDMREHALHTAMLDEKFRHIVYGGAAEGHGDVGGDLYLEAVVRTLRSLSSRRAAVLFQARAGDGRVCTWLVTAGATIRSVERVAGDVLPSLRPRLLRALGLNERLRGRAPAPRGAALAAATAIPDDSADEVLRQASRVLIPEPIARELSPRKIDTLVLVPSADVGTFPFAALPVDGRPLVEIASVVVAPGFEAFRHRPPPTPRPFRHAVIVGNPAYPRDRDYVLPDLPAAEAEAEEAARLVSARALTGKAATIRRVTRLLAVPGNPANLVYLATHGLSDAENPLDGSVLWLADGRWPARRISELPLAAGCPLVVLSACQTALGKTFDVGTIGMARAWMKAGASSVVMSLWRVDDDATRALMTRFLARATTAPVDRALREAMLETRVEYPDPSGWASFTVLGLPESVP